MKEKKVLFVTASDVFDEYGNGGTKGSQKNLKLIKDYFGEENVYVRAYIHSESRIIDEHTTVISRIKSKIGSAVAACMGCKFYFPWEEKKIKTFIKDKKIEILFIDGSVLGRLTKLDSSVKTIVFYHNIETDYAMNKVKHEGIQYIPSYCASKFNDKEGTRADIVMCLNQRDSNRLKDLFGRCADFYIPVTFSDAFDELRVETANPKDLLFVGSFFQPNQDAVEWFIKNVLPSLDDDVTFTVVGKGFECKKSEYESMDDRIKIVGSVQDLSEYYYSHITMVMPIRFGAGMKVKTAEAMMYGNCIFASDEALEGYEVENTNGIHRCNSTEDYINALSKYFSGEYEINNGFYKEVRNLFLEKYETVRFARAFNSYMDGCLNE